MSFFVKKKKKKKTAKRPRFVLYPLVNPIDRNNRLKCQKISEHQKVYIVWLFQTIYYLF